MTQYFLGLPLLSPIWVQLQPQHLSCLFCSTVEASVFYVHYPSFQDWLDFMFFHYVPIAGHSLRNVSADTLFKNLFDLQL